MPNDSVTDRSELEAKVFAKKELDEPKSRTEEVSILSVPKRDRGLFVAVFLLLTTFLHGFSYYTGKYDCGSFISNVENVAIFGNISLFGSFTAVLLFELCIKIWNWLTYLYSLHEQRVIRKHLKERGLVSGTELSTKNRSGS